MATPLKHRHGENLHRVDILHLRPLHPSFRLGVNTQNIASHDKGLTSGTPHLGTPVDEEAKPVGERHYLHPTRQIQDQTHKTVAPSAAGAQKPTPRPHQLHPTRRNLTKTNQTVAPSAAGAQKPTPRPYQLHPTRHIQAQTNQTVAPSAAGAQKPTPRPYQLHPTRHIQAQTNQTVAPSAVGNSMSLDRR